MKKGNVSRMLVFSLALQLLLLGVFPAYAAEAGQIMAKGKQEKELVLYVKNPGGIKSVSAQVGTAPCEDVSFSHASEEACTKTLLLVDNSASIRKNYRPAISEIMTDLVANRSANELFTVATFSDDIQYLAEDSADYAALKQAIDGIQYQNQDTYLIPVLYKLFSAWKQEGDTVYRKLVIFSDGASEEGIGYTMAELQSLIASYPYPIYAFGCQNSSGSNKAELENLFSLSRATNGEQFLLNTLEDTLQASSIVTAGNDVYQIRIHPPEQVLDGTEKGVQILMETGGGTVEASTSMTMPFVALAAPVEPDEPVQPDMPTAAPASTPTPVPSTEAEETGRTLFSSIFFWIALIVLLGGAVALVIVLLLIRRKKAKAFVPTPQQDPSVISGTRASGSGSWDDETRFIGRKQDMENEEEGETAFMWGKKQKKVILENKNNPMLRYEVPMHGIVVVGRSRAGDCQVVIDDDTVSRRHCDIYEKGGEVYVRDRDSRNGSFLDGAEFHHETKLYNGCTLQLGDVELRVIFH